MDTIFNTQSILCLCPGILGLERGLERALRTLDVNGTISESNPSTRVVAYVEIEAFIIANLVGQMEAGLLAPAPIWTNVKTFDARPFRNKVHGIIGGYPCQPFSHAGERRGFEDERHLWPYIFEQVKIIRPEFVYFENVAGHLSMGYDEVRRNLSSAGYRVEEGIFTAEEVGAPHRRERLFILGVMENASILGWGRRCFGDTQRNESKTEIKGSSTSLDNSNFECQYRCMGSCGRWLTEHSVPSGKLADTDRNGSDSSQNRQGTNKRKRNSTTRETIIFKSEGRSTTRKNEPVADTKYCNVKCLSGNDTSKKPEFSDIGKFPAGQGEYQYEWEEPRTIESSMVYTIDGYNFTEDLHRAIGNSVVEQTAELAFLTLLEKHIKNSIK